MGYCVDLLNRKRLATHEVRIGSVTIGNSFPVVIQSMTTTDTMDTAGSVRQTERMVSAGCEIVRLTAPSKKEAENLKEIKAQLIKKGISVPLVADIHFTPNAAEIAARHVEKVRINPGNFVDKKRFENLVLNDEEYKAELFRIENKLVPLLQLCKENRVALRIGTNHGSLSDRILSTYGDTPEGMVESALEFVKICEKHGFFDIVLSMKASNTRVMVYAYRYLCSRLLDAGKIYPLHLGVTEAGEGEDGRVKSAVGIGALLEDGIGDTIRVSLTEDPEEEIPVAKLLLNKFDVDVEEINLDHNLTYNPYNYSKRHTNRINNIGGDCVPVVFGSLDHVVEISPASFYALGYQYSVPLDKWNISEQACDFVYIGSKEVSFSLPEAITLVVDSNSTSLPKHKNIIPFYSSQDIDRCNTEDVFMVSIMKIEDVLRIKKYPNAIIIFNGSVQAQRALRIIMDSNNLENPVVLQYQTSFDEKTEQLWASSNLGCSFIDGFGDGIWISGKNSNQFKTSLGFGILQATRCRISKTEYISCPSCGRTLFDLQETTALIRKETEHLKGVKIGIMGCIVNGPGEMADADFGYVGSGPGKIHLYREKEIMKKNVPTDRAVEELISLIKEHGMWVDKG